MNIQYLDPFNRAWVRMKQALFKPFDLKKWFVVGFTAFLAGLNDYTGNTGSGEKGWSDVDWDEIMYFPQTARDWLKENPEWLAVIISGIVVVLLLIVLITWLSSRGKFMFLDNVIHDRALVRQPWHEFKVQGNSLFNWYLIFLFTVITVFILYLINCYNYLLDHYSSDMELRAILSPLIWMVIGFAAIALLVAFIQMLLFDFVVPLMYRYRLSAGDAWHMFLPLLQTHTIYFAGYAVLVLFIYILVVIGIILVGLFTCCIGFLFLLVPYISSVTLLPVSYTMRAFSLEFLAQFGPDYRIFAGAVTGAGNEIPTSV